MMNWSYVYCVVFIAGSAVLAIEIVGTRILGPFYGVSLFLWSALITTTLMALSLGYALGGRWADKSAKIVNLYYVVAGAGLWILFIPWLKHPNSIHFRTTWPRRCHSDSCFCPVRAPVYAAWHIRSGCGH